MEVDVNWVEGVFFGFGSVWIFFFKPNISQANRQSETPKKKNVIMSQHITL